MPSASIDDANCPLLHLIAQNTLSLLDSLPKPARLRAPLLAHTLRGLPADVAAELAGVGLSTLYSARSEFTAENLGELSAAYPSGVHRKRIASAELESIRNFIKEQCPAKTGSKREHYMQLMSSEDLYNRYRDTYADSLAQLVRAQAVGAGKEKKEPALETLVERFQMHEQALALLSFVRSAAAGSVSGAFGGGHLPGPVQLVLDYLLEDQMPAPAPRSRGVFEGIKDQLPLSQPGTKAGKFDCKLCAVGKSATAEISKLQSKSGALSEAEAEQLQDARKKLNTYEWHQRVLASQRDAIQKLVDHLPPLHSLVLLDFGTYDCEPNVSDKNKGQLHTLVCVVERPGMKRLYIDVLVADPETQKSDYFFVRAALLRLFAELDVFADCTDITFLSDTAAGQFRSRYSLPLFAALQADSGKTLRMVFRAAHHGWSLCDSHMGIVSQMLVRVLNAKRLERIQTPAKAEALLSPLPDAYALRDELHKHFSQGEHQRDHRCLILPSVDREPSLKPKTRPVPGSCACMISRSYRRQLCMRSSSVQTIMQTR